MITKFNNFLLEFNSSDTNFITDPTIGDKFTIAFEFELETHDTEHLEFIEAPIDTKT